MAGFGGWIIAACLAFGWPLLCAVLAGRRVWVVGTLASFALPASFVLDDLLLDNHADHLSRSDGGALLGCAGVTFLLGLIGTALAHRIISDSARRLRSPGPRLLTAQEEQEIAAVRKWLGERGVRARFEPGCKGDDRPVFAADRLIYEGRHGQNGWVGIRDGDQVSAWRALRRSVEQELNGGDELRGL